VVTGWHARKSNWTSKLPRTSTLPRGC